MSPQYLMLAMLILHYFVAGGMTVGPREALSPGKCPA